MNYNVCSCPISGVDLRNQLMSTHHTDSILVRTPYEKDHYETMLEQTYNKPTPSNPGAVAFVATQIETIATSIDEIEKQVNHIYVSLFGAVPGLEAPYPSGSEEPKRMPGFFSGTSARLDILQHRLRSIILTLNSLSNEM